MAFVQSYGAVKVVTGSAHLLTLENGKKILIDCGMFQGENEDKNSKPFEFNPHEIDWLILTHAHLDHVGHSPLLYKNGFSGTIIATPPTFELANIILLDSAHLMEEDYERNLKKALRRGEEELVEQPIYTKEDVESFWELERLDAIYDKEIKLEENLSVTFYNAGHILGSAFVKIEFMEEDVKKSVLFSGDLGGQNSFILPPLVDAKTADTLYIESTYGDRNHKNMDSSLVEFKEIINTTLARGGNVMIPSFAVERTQELLYIFKKMYKDGELPACKIILDSPMAISATKVYNDFPQELNQECQNYLKEDGSIFDFPYLEYAQSPEESMKINDITDRLIIIAGSGMCTGGRILHHLKHRLWNKKNALIFVGYQARKTLGRYIVDGAKMIRLYHEEIQVNAELRTINGFSAHADQAQLITWMSKFDKLGNVYLIHGEEEKQIVFKKAIFEKLGKKAHIIEEDERIFI